MTCLPNPAHGPARLYFRYNPEAEASDTTPAHLAGVPRATTVQSQSYAKLLKIDTEVTGMELTITVTDEAKSALEERARERGCRDLNKYVEQLIAIDLLAAKPFDEILAPIRSTFQASGLSEGDISTHFEEARDEAYAERKAREL